MAISRLYRELLRFNPLRLFTVNTLLLFSNERAVRLEQVPDLLNGEPFVSGQALLQCQEVCVCPLVFIAIDEALKVGLVTHIAGGGKAFALGHHLVADALLIDIKRTLLTEERSQDFVKLGGSLCTFRVLKVGALVCRTDEEIPEESVVLVLVKDAAHRLYFDVTKEEALRTFSGLFPEALRHFHTLVALALSVGGIVQERLAFVNDVGDASLRGHQVLRLAITSNRRELLDSREISFCFSNGHFLNRRLVNQTLSQAFDRRAVFFKLLDQSIDVVLLAQELVGNAGQFVSVNEASQEALVRLVEALRLECLTSGALGLEHLFFNLESLASQLVIEDLTTLCIQAGLVVTLRECAFCIASTTTFCGDVGGTTDVLHLYALELRLGVFASGIDCHATLAKHLSDGVVFSRQEAATCLVMGGQVGLQVRIDFRRFASFHLDLSGNLRGGFDARLLDIHQLGNQIDCGVVTNHFSQSLRADRVCAEARVVGGIAVDKLLNDLVLDACGLQLSDR